MLGLFCVVSSTSHALKYLIRFNYFAYQKSTKPKFSKEKCMKIIKKKKRRSDTKVMTKEGRLLKFLRESRALSMRQAARLIKKSEAVNLFSITKEEGNIY
jgi:hypothetical protein